jgi:hypothetical protein
MRWADLYEAPRRLALHDGQKRIFAPQAYRRVREAQVAPIVLSEMMTLAAWSPICWRIDPQGPYLCVLRSLLPDGTGQPVDTLRNPDALPLVLHAYPVVVTADASRSDAIAFDPVFADQPSDIGSPILFADGAPTKSALQRAAMATQIAAEIPATDEWTARLAEADLFEPWPLRFDVEGEPIDIQDLVVLSAEKLRAGQAYRLVRELGPAAARFIAAHRISLFRVGLLLAAARSFRRSLAAQAGAPA